MPRECNHCHKRAKNLKMCAACSMVWYCGSECQRNDWLVHLINCNPGRPITTADRLVAGIHNNRLVMDCETLQDYGFTHNMTPEGADMRIEAYRILTVDLQVKAKNIDRWMEAGILDKMMRETFDTRLSPYQRQQPSILWFYNNQSTFCRQVGPSGESEAMGKMRGDAVRAALKYMGLDLNSLNLDETAESPLEKLPKDHQTCFIFLTTLYLGAQPAPSFTNSDHLWTYFGFCGCDDPRREKLKDKYVELIGRVSYDTFYQAYASSSLPKLLADNGLAIHDPYVLDALSSRNYKSVWHLKEFVVDDSIPEINPGISFEFFGVDYGFDNCQTADEVTALRNAYKQVFMRADANPLALHEACLRGELFGYVGKLARLKPAQLFKRLMQNPYPL